MFVVRVGGLNKLSSTDFTAVVLGNSFCFYHLKRPAHSSQLPYSGSVRIRVHIRLGLNVMTEFTLPIIIQILWCALMATRTMSFPYLNYPRLFVAFFMSTVMECVTQFHGHYIDVNHLVSPIRSSKAVNRHRPTLLQADQGLGCLVFSCVQLPHCIVDKKEGCESP